MRLAQAASTEEVSSSLSSFFNEGPELVFVDRRFYYPIKKSDLIFRNKKLEGPELLSCIPRIFTSLGINESGLNCGL
jgi:hypothetical protein